MQNGTWLFYWISSWQNLKVFQVVGNFHTDVPSHKSKIPHIYIDEIQADARMSLGSPQGQPKVHQLATWHRQGRSRWWSGGRGGAAGGTWQQGNRLPPPDLCLAGGEWTCSPACATETAPERQNPDSCQKRDCNRLPCPQNTNRLSDIGMSRPSIHVLLPYSQFSEASRERNFPEREWIFFQTFVKQTPTCCQKYYPMWSFVWDPLLTSHMEYHQCSPSTTDNNVVSSDMIFVISFTPAIRDIFSPLIWRSEFS